MFSSQRDIDRMAIWPSREQDCPLFTRLFRATGVHSHPVIRMMQACARSNWVNSNRSARRQNQFHHKHPPQPRPSGPALSPHSSLTFTACNRDGPHRDAWACGHAHTGALGYNMRYRSLCNQHTERSHAIIAAIVRADCVSRTHGNCPDR